MRLNFRPNNYIPSVVILTLIIIHDYKNELALVKERTCHKYHIQIQCSITEHIVDMFVAIERHIMQTFLARILLWS